VTFRKVGSEAEIDLQVFCLELFTAHSVLALKFGMILDIQGSEIKKSQEEMMRKILLVMLVLGALSTSAFAVAPPPTLVPLKITINLVNGIDKVTVFKAGGGQVSICSQATCSLSLPSGTKLILTATSDAPTFGFFGWGHATGSASTCANTHPASCAFTLTQASEMPAIFKHEYNFKVQVGNGDGHIKVSLDGTFLFDCTNKAPLACSLGTLEGNHMKIEAIANQGSQFQKFSAQTGDATACTGQGANFTCSITITKDTSLVANFIPIP
jgi:hypothetical protein